jgi:opacity protein-like surface antigen
MVFGCALVQSVPSQALGQGAPVSQPSRGVLQNRVGPAELGHALDAEWSVLGSNNDGVTAVTRTNLENATPVAGSFVRPTGSLAYRFRTRSVTFNASAGAGGRYYSGLEELNSMDANESATLTAELGTSTQVRGTQRLQSAPYFQFNPFGGLITTQATGPTVPDVPLFARRSLEAEIDAGLTRRLGRSSQAVFEYGYGRTTYPLQGGALTHQRADGRYLHKLTRYSSLRLGYGRDQSEGITGGVENAVGGVERAVRVDTIDVGVDYSRRLSFSRKTTIGFSSGVASVSGAATASQDAHRDYTLALDGRLRRELARRWDLDVAYHRGIQFLPDFVDAFFADTVQAQVSGLINRHVQFYGSGGYSTGQRGSSLVASGYSSATGSAGVRFAFTRFMAVDAGYTYARYDFGSDSQLPSGLRSRWHSHGVQAGVSGLLPLVH